MHTELFDKILIANRGEIACRIMQTCRRLGIGTVAVYSDADRGARHVRLADEAVHIGAAPASQSYLRIDRLIDAALRGGARAVHPGYGFLAENEDFAAACAGQNLTFIGPPVIAIRAMGSKSAAKELMTEAGVPLIPGYHGAEQAADFLSQQADRVGYPVLIKASAGGGGKGMRPVETRAAFAAALESCRRESVAAFGDGRVLLEKYVQRPRHVEIQVFGDRHGKVVPLLERDCSAQRRHQKILEEAPAPHMTPALRARMGESAVRAASAVGYVGAGTVEFLLDAQGHFYFMEMNTRLQVEHPVTEMITGLDLVEWQLRVAAGEPLPPSWAGLAPNGHAIETRIYAEDPDKGFLPSVGKLIHLATPVQSTHVRLDAGVEQGDEITPYYDPMIAKLIVWGTSREEARRRLRQALAQVHIVGVAHNIGLLSRIVDSPAFIAGEFDTGFIEREGVAAAPATAEQSRDTWALATLAILLHERGAYRGADAASNSILSSEAAATDDGKQAASTDVSPWNRSDGWRLNSSLVRTLTLTHGEQELQITVEYLPDGFRVAPRSTTASKPLSLKSNARSNSGSGSEGDTHSAASADADADADGVHIDGQLNGTSLRAEIGHHTVHADAVFHGGRLYLFAGGRADVFTLAALAQTAAAGAPQGDLRAPMPGRVVALLAAPGAVVKKGTPLLVLEAMKMEHTITAPRDGRIKRFRFAQDAQVKEGQELVEFEL